MMGSLFSRFNSRGFSMRTRYAKNSNNPIQLILDQLISITNIRQSIENPMQCLKIQNCLELMKSITLQDIGLSSDDVKALQKLQCVTIYSCPSFDIAAFFLPQGKSLPIHNHPKMTVLSHIICGDLYVRSFSPNTELVSTNGEIPVSIDLDIVKHNTDGPWLLTPMKGNYHEFKALSTCIVFDILLPPYHEPDRPCTYYTFNKDKESLSVSRQPMMNNLPYTVQYKGYQPLP